MNKLEHLLTIASEECAEVAQRCTKAARFGLDETQPTGGDGLHPEGGNREQFTNRERIRHEYIDLIAAMSMLGIVVVPYNSFVDDRDRARFHAKIEKVEKFLEYSKRSGTLRE